MDHIAYLVLGGFFNGLFPDCFLWIVGLDHRNYFEVVSIRKISFIDGSYIQHSISVSSNMEPVDDEE